VFLALVVQHAVHMRRIVMWPVQLYNIFPHYLINGTIFENKLFNTNVCFDFLYNFLPQHFSF